MIAVLIAAACDLLPQPSPTQLARPPVANPTPNLSPPLSGTIITIYLPRLFADGSLGLAGVQRGIPPQDDPLWDALEALIQGPTGDERAEDYEIALDRHTRVLSARRDGDTALVELDDNLNRVRGRPFSELVYWAIVYTATEAPGIARLGLVRRDAPLTQFGYPAIGVAPRAGRADAPSWVRPR